MSGPTSFVEAVEKIIKENTPVYITEGTVNKVNADSVDVARDNLPTLYKVRLQATLDPGVKGILILPKIGSNVLCAIVDNNPNDAFVISANDIDTITIHGGSNGGLTITPTLVENLGKLSSRVDGIINAITKGVPIAQDGGVGYQASMAVLLETLIDVEDFSKIENKNITH